MKYISCLKCSIPKSLVNLPYSLSMFVLKGSEFPGIHCKLCSENIKEWSVKDEDLDRIFNSCKICLIRVVMAEYPFLRGKIA